MTPKPDTKGKSLLFHRETFIIVLIVIAALALTTIVFSLIWAYFKIGFVWLVCFIIFFIVRKTDLWKYGFEIHFLLLFLTTYAYGMIFSFTLFLGVLYIVFKIRPDEFEGCVINFIGLTLLVLAVAKIASVFGPGISETAFFWSAMIVVSASILIDMLMTLRIYPYLWMKLIVTHLVDIFVQYYIISSLGLTLLHFLLKVKSAAP